MTIENILLDLNGNCKLSNFNSYIEMNGCDVRIRYDLERLGFLVYQMITGKKIEFLGKTNCIDDVQYNRLTDMPFNSSNEIKEFVAEYLVLKEVSDSKQTTLDIKINPFFSEIDWNKLEQGEIKSPFKIDSVIFYFNKSLYFRYFIIKLLGNISF